MHCRTDVVSAEIGVERSKQSLHLRDRWQIRIIEVVHDMSAILARVRMLVLTHRILLTMDDEAVEAGGLCLISVRWAALTLSIGERLICATRGRRNVYFWERSAGKVQAVEELGCPDV